MTGSNVVLTNDYRHRLVKVARTMKKMLDEVQCNAFMMKEKAYIATRIQSASSVNIQDPADRLLFNVIVDHCVKAEKFGPGAFGYALEFILDRILSPVSLPFPDVSAMSEGSIRPTWNELQAVLSREITDCSLQNILFEALNLAGLEGRIFVERGIGTISSVERVNGYNFHVKLPVPFTGTRQQVRVAVIDGMIETVSEIHHLLQKFSETKETLLLVLRGISDDVTHTLKVNMGRKTLDVIPVIVKYDFEGLNVLNDIALVCNTDVVSSMKGQLISAIQYDSLAVIPSMTFKDDVLTLVNDKVISRTELQIRQLIEKSQEAELEQFKQIYDDRIRSLTPSSVRVRIVNDRAFSDFAEKIDVSLRVVRSSLRHGLFSKARMRTGGEAFSGFPDPVPVETVAASVLYAKRCLETLEKIQAVIIA